MYSYSYASLFIARLLAGVERQDKVAKGWFPRHVAFQKDLRGTTGEVGLAAKQTIATAIYSPPSFVFKHQHL